MEGRNLSNRGVFPQQAQYSKVELLPRVILPSQHQTSTIFNNLAKIWKSDDVHSVKRRKPQDWNLEAK